MRIINFLRLFILILLFISSGCNDSYLDSKKIKLEDFELVKRELNFKSDLVVSSFVSANNRTNTRHILLGSFEADSSLVENFPFTYNLLKNKKAILIDFYTKDCFSISLKSHSGVFVSTLEQLVFNKTEDCSLNHQDKESIKKRVLLNGGWIYQIVLGPID